MLSTGKTFTQPKKNFNACNDFFILIIESHIVAAAMKVLGMTNTSEIPDSSLIPDTDILWTQSEEHRRHILHTISTKIVNSFLDLNFNAYNIEHDTHMPSQLNLYTKHLLSLGCFYLKFSDAIKEGDGIASFDVGVICFLCLSVH